MINVELKGGTVKEFESGVTPAEIAKSIGMGLYKSVCCARVDGNVVDLRTPCLLYTSPSPRDTR